MLILRQCVCVCVCARYVILVNQSVETPLAIVSAHSAKRASLGKSPTVCMRVCKSAPSDVASSVFSFLQEREGSFVEAWTSKCTVRFPVGHVYEYIPREYVSIHLSPVSSLPRPGQSPSYPHAIHLVYLDFLPSRMENNISLSSVSY